MGYARPKSVWFMNYERLRKRKPRSSCPSPMTDRTSSSIFQTFLPLSLHFRAANCGEKKSTPSQVVHLIKAERNIDKALDIFDSATADYVTGFCHDLNTFGVMISKLVSANKFRLAENLLDRMKMEKCNIRADIFLSISRGYGRVHRSLHAMRAFDKMKGFQSEPSKKSYITEFDILVKENL
ncbi:hypothetical protein DITRI_Ditri02bG0036500 [Diplodiscus trichospermus]